MSSLWKHHRFGIQLFRHGCNGRSKITNIGFHKFMESHFSFPHSLASTKIPQFWEKIFKMFKRFPLPFSYLSSEASVKSCEGSLPSSSPVVYIFSGLQNIYYTPPKTLNSSSLLLTRKIFLLKTSGFLRQVSPDT